MRVKGDHESITEFHGDDLDKGRLTLHRNMFNDISKQGCVCLTTFCDALDFLMGQQGRATQDPAVKTHQINQTWTHRSCDLLHCPKTYLRPTMGQGRLTLKY